MMATKFRKKNAISTAFAARSIPMLESAAYRALSLSAHRILSRLEIEHARHSGAENGRLPLTYDQLVEYGLHRRMIAPAFRELRALGFVEITQQGAGGNADFRRPSLYRLTTRHAKGEGGDGTHEYLRIGSTVEAEEIARRARHVKEKRPVTRRSKRREAGSVPPDSIGSGTECTEPVVALSATGKEWVPVALNDTEIGH